MLLEEREKISPLESLALQKRMSKRYINLSSKTLFEITNIQFHSE